MSRYRALQPADFPWFDYGRYTFSLGLKHGQLAYLSGHSASEHDPQEGHIVVRGGMAAQARTAYAKVERILAEAGLGFADVIRVVENVTGDGIEHYGEAEAVRAEIFGKTQPAVNTVCVDGLLRPTAWIEIEVVAGSSEDLGSSRQQERPAYAPARDAGGIVYLSSCLPVDESGRLVGEGDLQAQAQQVYANINKKLAAVGLGTEQVVKTVDYVAWDALKQYKATGRVRREHLTEPYPAATGILMSRLAQPGALIQVDVMASRHPTEAINPGWDRYQKLTYSPGVRAGNVLFLSGQAALDPETEEAVHPGDVAAQAEYTYANVIKVLEAAGAGPEDIVKTVEYVTPEGLPRYREVAAVRERLLTAPWPASTGIVCRGLLRPEFQLEIDPLAIVGP